MVKQVSTKYFTLIKQPNFRFQVSFYIMFDKERYNIKEVKDSYLELVNDAFVASKTKQVIALLDRVQLDTESENIAYVGNSEKNDSRWSYNRIAIMTIVLHNDKTKSGIIQDELPITKLSTLNNPKKTRTSRRSLVHDSALTASKSRCM